MPLPKIELRDPYYDFIATFLILFQPYLQFAYTNGFVFETTNIIVLAGYVAATLAITLLINRFPSRLLRSIVIAALIILFLDFTARIFDKDWYYSVAIVAGCFAGCWLLYRHAGKILAAVFGVIFVAGFMQPIWPQVEDYPTAKRLQSSPHLPVYVHIILDEHGGIEGLDHAVEKQGKLKQDLKEFYVDNGFRIFGRAYSEYASTLESISAALNNYSGTSPGSYYSNKRSRGRSHSLLENKYLHELSRAGYGIRVYQSTYFDFCASATDIIQQCLTYDAFNAPSGVLHQFTMAEKLDFVLTLYWSRSFLKGNLHRGYVFVELVFKEFGIRLPHWVFVPARSSAPIPSSFAFDQLISDVAQTSGGIVFFAHFLVPHHSYALDEVCNVQRPLFIWEDAWTGQFEHNSESSRLDRYSQYVEQTRCVMRKVEDLIGAMRSAGTLDDAIIILHGDHGSRIFQHMPTISRQAVLTPQDYYDGYATLFAVKAPHISPGYDLRMASLRHLLQSVPDSAALESLNTDDHAVYLPDFEIGTKPRYEFIKVPMPAIPGGTNGQQGGRN